MRQFPSRLAVLLATALTLAILPTGTAGAAVPTVTLAQTGDGGAPFVDQVTITAEVRDGDGAAEPDGTFVQFQDLTMPVDNRPILAGRLIFDVAAHGSGAGDGYWMLDFYGDVLPFGGAPDLGDAVGLAEPGSFVAIATNGTGYLLVTFDGAVFPFGLPFLGDLRNIQLQHPIIAATVLPDGTGYRLYAQDGGVFDFGAAGFAGSAAAFGATIADVAQTPSGDGYWILARDGRVFAFGDAFGDTDGPPSPVGYTAIVAHTGGGYWLVRDDGTFAEVAGAPSFFGKPADPSDALTGHGFAIVGAAGTPDGTGMYIVDYLGRLAGKGSADSMGSVWTVPSVAGRATFTFTALAPGRTTVGVAVPQEAIVSSISQTWVSAHGYRLVAGDGGIFSFGDAPFHGSTGNLTLNQPIVGMAPTPTGNGYWFVAADGGIFTYGDAVFHGSMGATSLNQPIVGMAPTPTGNGYWFVAADGGIFTYGDAPFFGSAGGETLAQPIVGMAARPSGGGYWLVAADGRVLDFGDANHFGPVPGQVTQVVGMATTLSGRGYWLVTRDGTVVSFGDAPYLGSMSGIPLTRPVVGMAAH